MFKKLQKDKIFLTILSITIITGIVLILIIICEDHTILKNDLSDMKKTDLIDQETDKIDNKQLSEFLYQQYEEIAQINASELIEIDNKDEIFSKRAALIKYIWKDKLPLQQIPSAVNEKIYDKRFFNLTNLKQIDEIKVEMNYGVFSKMYHFRALESNKNLVIYHQGHKGDFFLGYDTIEALLKNGYDVIAISMPLLGANNQPIIKLERFGEINFSTHDHFRLLDNENFSSLKFFLEPVIVALNYAQKLSYDEIDMVGISGGGWTTVLASAVDDRITKSYPVAGSYPLYLRTKDSFGDYEQNEPGLYQIANYLELYIMGSYGKNRKQVQIINTFDSCCFRGYKYLSYKETVQKKMSMLGEGNFTIFTDETHYEHIISDNTLRYIINDLDFTPTSRTRESNSSQPIKIS